MKDARQSIRNWAWTVIVLHFLVEVLWIMLAIAYLNLGLDTVLPTASHELGLYILYALIPLAAIAFTIDREVVTEQTGWTPSNFYYLLSLPFVFNIVISAQYIYKRHKYLGTP